MDTTYSVGELARLVAPVVSWPDEPSESDIELVIRRLRNWTVAGALVPIGDPNSGTGKHRGYDRAAVFNAAILNNLADNDQSIGSLLSVSRLIRNLSGPTPLLAGENVQLWRDAVAGKGDGDIFLIMETAPRRRGRRGTRQALVREDGLRQAISDWTGGIFVNLTSVLSRLSP